MGLARLQFGEFELDCDRYELRRDGRSVKIEKLPLDLLILLAENSDRLVSRGEIVERLWGAEVFVDSEHGINTAVRKVRQTLRDDPESPRFIQTVTGRGYRFVACVITACKPQAAGNGGFATASHQGVAAATLPVSSNAGDDFTVQDSVEESKWFGRLRRMVWILILAALGVIAALSIYGWRTRSERQPVAPRIAALAVLPLDNLSGDPGQDYFADGMTDELTTMLAKNSTLRIVSRTSVMQYKGAHRPLRDIARELGVDGILEGSVERSGDKVHMTVQLIQAPNDTHIWAESYDRDANDVVMLPAEAAQAVAERLNSAVPASSPARYVRPEAHDAYLHGRYLWFQGQHDRSAEYFRKTTELQPDYALGWSGLADYYGAGAVEGLLDPRQAIPSQDAATRKAVALDDSLP